MQEAITSNDRLVMRLLGRKGPIVGLFLVFIMLWVFRSLSRSSYYGVPKCSGKGCLDNKQLTNEIQEELDQARQIDPFTPGEIEIFDLDDDEPTDDDNDDGRPKIKIVNQNAVINSIPQEHNASKPDDDDDDKNEKGELIESVFKPLEEGTLGYAVKHYQKPLVEVENPQMIVKEGEEADIPMDSGVHVITTFFHGTYHDRRFKELMATLVSNLENPTIAAMHVLWQGSDPRYFIPNEIASKLVAQGFHKKLILTEVKKQPTYKVMFAYANEKLKRGAVAIVTNADIYFDTSLKCVSLPPKNYTTLYYHPEKIKTRIAFALSRRHSPECKGKPDHRNFFDLCEDYTLSHDAFVFAPPVPNSIVMRTDHTQNQGYGAENIVIFEFKREKYKVLNPCFTLKGYHLHCVNERHYVATFVNRNPPRPGASWPVKRKCDLWVY